MGISKYPWFSLLVRYIKPWRFNISYFLSFSGFHSPGIFVYIAHLVFLTVFGVTSMHVQVSVMNTPAHSVTTEHMEANYEITKKNLRLFECF